MALPRLVGVIHLPALPGSPCFGSSPLEGGFSELVESAARDAQVLAEAGFDGVMVENFGDAPFYPEQVPPETIACMTACALAVREAAPQLALGINVLRNDASAALGIAAATGASMIRVNVHTGARVTDQGIVEGRAHETLRRRASLGLESVALLCDVAVKHSAPLSPRPIAEEIEEVCERGLADAVLLTGTGTGRTVHEGDLSAAVEASSRPVYLASGVTPQALQWVGRAHGAIVGSWLRASGRAGGPIDPARAAQLSRLLC